MLTAKEIQEMNPQELAVTKARLTKQVVAMFTMLFAAKWAILIGLNIFGRKLRKNQAKSV